ncbi:MAG: helix-turn-helix transcriptional regulator, partial [Chlamydiia bacterium]|nr:helix-turn-helix transcriptional regulator [Chlamydiia bacterium]
MNISSLPIPAGKALKKLGYDLKNARRKRRISTQLASDRAGISRGTLVKIEKGDPGVSIGAYARVLFILGMIQKLLDLADPKFDELGQWVE